MKTSIKEYKPQYLAEYLINNELRRVPLPVNSIEQMKMLRKAMKTQGIDLELDDQIIKGSRLVRFFESRPKNDFDYLLTVIADEEVRDRFIILRKRRRAENKTSPVRVLRNMYQTDYLGVGQDERVECNDPDAIVKLLEPTYWQ